MKTLALAACAAAFTFAQAAFAHDFKLGDLEIAKPMSFATAPTAKTGAGFMTITNSGASDDTLVEVRADFPRVELHKTEEQDGVMKMLHQENGIVVPAGGAVELKHGSYHVMFMGLSEALIAGESIPATLVFEKAGELPVKFKIEKRGHGAGHGSSHSGHAD